MNHLPQNSDGAQREIALRKGEGSPAALRMPLADHIPTPTRAPDYGGLLEYWRMIRRHQGTVLVIAALGAVTGVLIGLPQTPIYRSRTTIEIQPLNENLLNTREVNPTPAVSDYYYS